MSYFDDNESRIVGGFGRRVHRLEPKRFAPSQVATCRTCGEECIWHHTGLRWALMGDNGRLHTCNVSDDFDNLTKD